MSADYAIIGGGIAGASVAYHLGKKSDKDIILFERQALASETTYRSMATLGTTGSGEIRTMKEYGLQLYNELFRESVTNVSFELTGAVKIATSKNSAEELRQEEISENPFEGENTMTQYYPANEIKEKAIIPYLDCQEITGIKYRPNTGFTKPLEVTQELIKRAKSYGVKIRQNSAVQDIITECGKVNSIVVDNREIEVDAVICAAGPWNTSIADSAGVNLPVKNEEAPVIRLDPMEDIKYSFPYTYHQDTGIWFRGSLDGSVYVGYHDRKVKHKDLSKIDPVTVSDNVSAEFIDKALSVVEKLYPFLLDADISEEWVGVGSRTPDYKPIIGYTSTEGFMIVSFHSQGIQLAPAAGKIVTQQLIEHKPTEHYPSVSISRFDEYSDSFY